MKTNQILIAVGVVVLLIIIFNWNNIFGKKDTSSVNGERTINAIPDWSNIKTDYETENTMCFRIAVGTSCPNEIKRFGKIHNRATKVPVGYEGWCCFGK